MPALEHARGDACRHDRAQRAQRSWAMARRICDAARRRGESGRRRHLQRLNSIRRKDLKSWIEVTLTLDQALDWQSTWMGRRSGNSHRPSPIVHELVIQKGCRPTWALFLPGRLSRQSAR
eukprot:3924537-Pyramimonas_sp.AAC.1